MKILKLNVILTAAVMISALIFSSCKTLNESPEGCVVSFIVAAEKRNMSRAWENLSPEAQSYYNSQGEKMRKSGKGALENKIAGIEKFKTVKQDYKVEPDKDNNSVVNIISTDGKINKIETVVIDGSYRLKNESSVNSLLEGITSATKKTDGY